MVSAAIYQVSKEELEKNPKKKRDYDGIVKKRWTTDILFAVLIWMMWGAMSYVGYTGIKSGNPYTLTAPMDWSGSVCGYDQSNSYLYTVIKYGLGVCVESCPTVDATLTSVDPNDYYCFSSVPSDPTLRSAYISATCMTSGVYSINSLCLCNIKRNTASVLRRCIFADTTIRTQYSNQSAPSYFQNFIADIWTARNIIFGFGFGLAIFLSFVWSHLLSIRWLGYIVVWTGLAGTLGIMIALCYIAERTAATWGRENPAIHTADETLALTIFAWILLGVSILFFCMMVFLRKQINLSVKILALTSTCIDDMKFIVFTPILNLAAFVLFMVPCIVYMFYVASDGSFNAVLVNGVAVGRQYTPAPGVIDRLWFLFFCLLWTMNFIGGISAISIAISCAKWYFTEERSITSVNSFTVLRSILVTIRFHWGTAAFGSLLIAIVQFVRWYLLWLQKHYNQIVGTNMILKLIFCCVQCCLACLECCIKFISKHAYIQTAIHGSSFCTGCKDAFYEIARNIFRVGAISVIGGLALFVGKAFVICATVGASFFYLDQAFNSQLNGIVGPLVLIGLIAWFTASMFFDVYHMSLDTIFMCYLSDEEAHDGNPKFVDGNFKAFIEENGKIAPGEQGTTTDADPSSLDPESAVAMNH